MGRTFRRPVHRSVRSRRSRRRPPALQGARDPGPRRGRPHDGLGGGHPCHRGTLRPGALITVTHSAPSGMRKLSRTLAHTLDSIEDPGPWPATTWPVTRESPRRLPARRVARRRGGRDVLVVVADHVVSYEDRVCDMLSAGGAAAFVISAEGFASLGAVARDSKEIYDVWRLGTERGALPDGGALRRYLTTQKNALAKLEKATGNAASSLWTGRGEPAAPQTVRGLESSASPTRRRRAPCFVGDLGNMGAASLGVSLALALDGAQAKRCLHSGTAPARASRRRSRSPPHRPRAVSRI